MGIFAKVVSSIVGRDPRGWSMLTGVWPSRWTNANNLFVEPSVADMELAYAHPIVRACVDEIKNSLAEPQFEVGREVKGEWQPVDRHPALDLLRKPNDAMSRNDLIKLMVMRWELTGIGYVQKLRNRGKQIGELWPLPSSWVETEYNEYGVNLIAYYKVKGQKMPVFPEDMMTLRHLDPASVVGHSGPYMASQHDHALDVERENYLAEMLLNLKVPGMTVVNKDGFTSEKDRKDAKRDIRNAIGRGNRGEPLLLEGDVTVTMQNPLGDMDWPNFAGSIEARICMAFGVPPIIIGSRFGLTRSTYANYEQARESFYKETLRPKWVALGEALTRGLRELLGENDLEIRVRYDELPEFLEGETDKATRIQGLYQTGLLPKTVAQRELGYDPDELASAEEEELARIAELYPDLPTPGQQEEEDEDEEDVEEEDDDAA